MQYQVRLMQASDVDAILALQTLAYPGFLLESADFFQNRLALAPAHCWVAQPAASPDALLGYLISYPWDAGLPPALDVALATLPAAADHWFLHDCAEPRVPGIRRGLLAAPRLPAGQRRQRRPDRKTGWLRAARAIHVARISALAAPAAAACAAAFRPPGFAPRAASLPPCTPPARRT